MAVPNLANILVALKAQSALGAAATGSGATGIEVMPSQGLQLAVATIESQMIQRSRMRKRPRQGSRSSNTSYETEVQVGNLDVVYEAVLGGTWAAQQTLDESDLTSLTISGTGVTLTFAGGNVLTEGVRVGMMAQLAGMSVSGNNGKWFPILDISANGRVLTIPTGILADNTTDTEFDLIVAKSVYTATPYTDRYFTVEEYLTEIDRSKLGTDMRFNSLNLSIQPDQYVRAGFGLGGRDLDLAVTGSSPTFSSPAYIDGPSLTLLDGGVYVNGTKRTGSITGLTAGISAPVSTVPVVDGRISPDVFLGQFGFAGQITAVADGSDWDLMDAETQISLVLHCAEQGGVTADFVTFYFGNLSFGGWGTGAGGEGAAIATMQLYGGEDERGGAHAASTMLVSTSAA